MSTGNTSAFATGTEAVLNAAATVLAAIMPGGTILNFAAPDVVALIEAVAGGVPAVVAAVADIKSAIDGGMAPTAAQLAALRAGVDAADDALEADVKSRDAS